MTYLAVSNYGQTLHLETKYPRKELMDYFGVKHAERIYRDTKDGTKHIGWIIAGQWWNIYSPCEWNP